MATPMHYVKKARKDIYTFGKQVTYEGEEGSKRAGRKMTKIDRTIPHDSSDPVLIQKGESYYWWEFMRGPVMYSKTRPKRSQLTQSEFNSWLFDFQDDTIGSLAVSDEELEAYTPDDLSAIRDDWITEIGGHRDECQESLDNMPESLQDSSASGEILTQRIEGLDSWISDLESIDIDWDDEELRSEAEEELRKASNEEAGIDADKLAKKFLELKRNKIEEIVGELQSQDPGL